MKLRREETFAENYGEFINLDRLVDINNDWSEPSRCSLTVGPPRPSKASRERPPWELLRDIIHKDNEIFVYSVGPKNYLQRISTATQLDQTLALEGGGRAGVSGETAQGAATFQQQVNRKRGEIENHALILPIVTEFRFRDPQIQSLSHGQSHPELNRYSVSLCK